MKRKIWITLLLLVVSTSIVTSIISMGFEKSQYFKDIEGKIGSTKTILRNTLSSKEKWDEYQLKEIVNSYSELLGGQVSISLYDGRIISSHEYNPSHQRKEELLYSDGISFEDGYIKELNISIYNEDISRINRQFGRRVFVSLLVSMVIGLLIGMRHMEYAIEPYRALTKATQNIIDGIYEEEIVFHDDKELEYLAENFNFMSRKLQNTIGQLQEANTKLKATLISIGDGVIAFDNRLNIILINPYAEKILELDEADAMGKGLEEVIRDEKLKKVFLELIELGLPKEIEIERKQPNDRILTIYANPIMFRKYSTGRLGTVFVIQDITKMKRLERVREDFVANVSHELKTPLTSIKGFIETLKDGAIKNRDLALKFLNIMDGEVNRLNRLVEDLLLLSEVENRKLDIIPELIYVEEVLDEVFQMLGREAAEKNIMLEKEILGNAPPIQGNYNYFKQMLINLIDNGIKYTPEGGYVKTSIEVEKGHLMLKIMDNGVGIAKEEQDRIFERFYRVDKSRSRDVGGTGLGLAIVKHVVSVFNGNIEIESHLNEGTTFQIRIPIEGA
ncbi:sensor histidine kinase [Clostridium sp. Cult3]|uniref:sensor histidine kinase n=1 Tax=Clostridium sp. Cult3 TaxID=2079004 RepID=UPI001F257641|nr:ATP-binding protein [Clostridium sp. Cult3]MCF6460019.1 PAS domain-containing sensor histidine kinase [Clostridium sp. Cult3]